MNTNEKIGLVKKFLAEGKHTVDIVTERVANPLLKGRGNSSFENTYGFSTENCVKTSEFDAICGGDYDYAHLCEKYNETKLDRPGKRVATTDEEVIVPGVLKKNRKTGNINLTLFKVKGFGKPSKASWTLDGKPFDPSKYEDFFPKAKKDSGKKDDLMVIKANIANVKSLVVDGKVIW